MLQLNKWLLSPHSEPSYLQNAKNTYNQSNCRATLVYTSLHCCRDQLHYNKTVKDHWLMFRETAGRNERGIFLLLVVSRKWIHAWEHCLTSAHNIDQKKDLPRSYSVRSTARCPAASICAITQKRSCRSPPEPGIQRAPLWVRHTSSVTFTRLAGHSTAYLFCPRLITEAVHHWNHFAEKDGRTGTANRRRIEPSCDQRLDISAQMFSCNEMCAQVKLYALKLIAQQDIFSKMSVRDWERWTVGQISK